MVTTDNETFNALLDAALTGDDRRLMMVGTGSSYPMQIMVGSDAFLEKIVEERRRALKTAEVALALSRVATLLNVNIKEKD